jgi:hypothetical protein
MLGLDRHEISRIACGEVKMSNMLYYALRGIEYANPGTPVSEAKLITPTAPMPAILCGDKWAIETARLGLPLLIKAAMSGEEKRMTYSDFHELVAEHGAKADVGRMTKYAFVLGKIATAMEQLTNEDYWQHEPVPPLTALVVNKVTRVPSEGINAFVYEYLMATDRKIEAKRLDDPERRHDVFAIVWQDIFRFPRWPEVLSAMGYTGDLAFDA